MSAVLTRERSDACPDPWLVANRAVFDEHHLTGCEGYPECEVSFPAVWVDGFASFLNCFGFQGVPPFTKTVASDVLGWVGGHRLRYQQVSRQGLLGA